MRGDEKMNNKHYEEVNIEVVPLNGGDVIACSTIFSAFNGEDHVISESEW